MQADELRRADDGKLSARDEQLVTLFGPAGAGVSVSSFTQAYYAPLPNRSATWASFLGFIGLAIPLVSVFGVRAALRARREGNRFTWALAAAWSVATAVVGSLVWLGVLG